MHRRTREDAARLRAIRQDIRCAQLKPPYVSGVLLGLDVIPVNDRSRERGVPRHSLSQPGRHGPPSTGRDAVRASGAATPSSDDVRKSVRPVVTEGGPWQEGTIAISKSPPSVRPPGSTGLATILLRCARPSTVRVGCPGTLNRIPRPSRRGRHGHTCTPPVLQASATKQGPSRPDGFVFRRTRGGVAWWTRGMDRSQPIPRVPHGSCRAIASPPSPQHSPDQSPVPGYRVGLGSRPDWSGAACGLAPAGPVSEPPSSRLPLSPTRLALRTRPTDRYTGGNSPFLSRGYEMGEPTGVPGRVPLSRASCRPAS